jgi:hypothetical protein
MQSEDHAKIRNPKSEIRSTFAALPPTLGSYGGTGRRDKRKTEIRNWESVPRFAFVAVRRPWVVRPDSGVPALQALKK